MSNVTTTATDIASNVLNGIPVVGGILSATLSSIVKGLGGGTPRGDYQRFTSVIHPVAKAKAAAENCIVHCNWFNGDNIVVFPSGAAGILFNLQDSFVPTNMTYQHYGSKLTEGSIYYIANGIQMTQLMSNALACKIVRWNSSNTGTSASWDKDLIWTTFVPNSDGPGFFVNQLRIEDIQQPGALTSTSGNSYTPPTSTTDVITSAIGGAINGVTGALTGNTTSNNTNTSSNNIILYVVLAAAGLIAYKIFAK